MKNDTIVAIATPLSESGIGIVRISGADAFAVADRVFRIPGGKRKLLTVPSHTVHYGFVVEKEDEENWKDYIIDEVMAVVMKGPRSFTAEDTVELQCHGGVLVLQKVLECVLKHGARLAEPGEFTKRAFLNGRIDLSRAEAVMDVIQSQNELALNASVKQLKGELEKKIKALRAKLIYEIAFIESALDDPEHISLDGYPKRLSGIVKEVEGTVERLIQSADDGRLMKEGIETVIVGKPNAGKSSLMNLLVGEERAIVTEIAGTTRDVLEEHIRLHGIGLNVIDTAGIRNTEDLVEKIGVDRAKKYAGEADLIIYMVDGSVPLDENDREIVPIIRGKKTIVLLNKTDLEQIVTEQDIYELIGNQNVRIVKTSTRENTGIEEFEYVVKEMFFKGEISGNEELVITNMRHKEALQEAGESLKQVENSINAGMPEDFYSIDLMSAYAALGRITGEEIGEDLVNEIFSRFCMGK